MNKDTINDVIADALEVEIEEVHPEKYLEDYDSFDSLVFLTLISLLEDVGVSLSTNDLPNIKKFEDVYKVAGL